MISSKICAVYKGADTKGMRIPGLKKQIQRLAREKWTRERSD